MQVAIVFLLLMVISTRQAEAYIDPGTGSNVLQLILGGSLGTLFIMKRYWHSIIKLLTGKKSKDRNSEEKKKEE